MIALATIACLFTSCNSLLDEDPKYSTNSSMVFSSSDNAELALLGCYSYMTANSAYGQIWQEVPIAGSGFSWHNRAGDELDNLCSLAVQPSNGEVSSAWKGMYKVISEVNSFIGSMEASSLADSIKTQKIGEAKFLRGIAYFNLTSLFGDVPLVISASSSDAIEVPRTEAKTIMAQVIQDFTDAAASMSATSTVGRANSWAAKAYLGKAYHKLACMQTINGESATDSWTKAKEQFDAVYTSGKYSLQSDFNYLFQGRHQTTGVASDEYVKDSPESIFQLNFGGVAGVDTYNRGNNRFAPATSTSGISWGTIAASKAGYDLMEGTYPNDPRIDATYITRYRVRTGNNQANPKAQVGDVLCANDSVYCYPYVTYTIPKTYVVKNKVNTTTLKQFAAKLPYSDFADPTNPSLSVITNYVASHGNTSADSAIANSISSTFAKSGIVTKPWPWYNKMYDQKATAQASHKNLMIFRYAEMLLMMADCYNELGNTSRAVELVNMVLKRARTSGGASSAQPADWSASSSQEQVRWNIYREGIIEFFGEPNMYEKIRIRGIDYFKKALQFSTNHEIMNASAALYATTTNAYLDRIFDDGTLSNDFLKKNLLLPIPQSEIDANPAITSQNYGY
jgi:hypothetical protein